mmetsp:Transcript_39575/g.84440  ORF Transcript_39575/g.84440 Transcript_39575/m.84440 type:complete len:90 (-) Transcript_39575:1162-1431(-)
MFCGLRIFRAHSDEGIVIEGRKVADKPEGENFDDKMRPMLCLRSVVLDLVQPKRNPPEAKIQQRENETEACRKANYDQPKIGILQVIAV